MFHLTDEISHGWYTTDINTGSNRAFTVNGNEIVNYRGKETPEK